MTRTTPFRLVVIVNSLKWLFSRFVQVFQPPQTEDVIEIKLTPEHEVAVIALTQLGAHIDQVVYHSEKFGFVGKGDSHLP